MKTSISSFKIVCFVLILSISIAPAAWVFAQLDGVAVTTEATTTPTADPLVQPTTETTATTQAPTEPIIETLAPSDTTAPVISGVGHLSLGLGEATIVWTTDEPAVSRLEYGTTETYGQNATLDASALLVHTAILTGLTSGTTYYYCIHATDLAHNTSNSCGQSFTTTAQASDGSGTSVIVDTTPPDISLVTVTSISPDSVTINWTTDSVANAQVEYGISAGYGEVTPLDTSLSLLHSVTLTGLVPNTQYHYRIRSADEIGNTATTPDNTFTTALLTSGEVTTTPVPSVSDGATGQTAPHAGATVSTGDTTTSVNATVLISAVETASIAASTVTITWQTDLPSDSQIEYGDSVNLGLLTPLNSALATSHSVTISNLSPNTNYIYRIKSKPAGGVAATVSSLHEFSTLSHSTPIVAAANIASVSASSITASGATITWTTDKTATSEVEYGLNTSYGQRSSLNSSLSASHSVSLANLDAGTTYHYRAKSVDEVGNIAFSDDHTVTTTASSTPLSAPASLSTLVIGGYDQHSVDLTWHTDVAHTDVFYEYDIRYGTSPITEENYLSAAQAQLTPIYHSDVDPEGTERNYIVAGLSPNTTYYFAVKSKHQTSGWSAVSNVVSAKTTTRTSVINASAHSSQQPKTTSQKRSTDTGVGDDGSYRVRDEYGANSGGNATASFEPTALKTQSADNQIIFQWNNPDEATFVRTILVRKDGGYPTSPTDGKTIYEGRGETFTDTNVSNGKTYYYALYSYNHSKTYSAPVRVSLAPNAGNTQIKFNESGSLKSVLPVMHFVRSHKKGDKDIEVEHLQEILAFEDVSFPENMVTGYFGSMTENALKKFQTKHGLSVTGVVDMATQKKLNTVSRAETKLAVPGDFVVFATDMKSGDRGESIKNLQEFLSYEGSYSEKLITGYFGAFTRTAVMDFQKKYGISPVSGYVGYKTRQKMQQLTGF